jgi:hypothetical protein
MAANWLQLVSQCVQRQVLGMRRHVAQHLTQGSRGEITKLGSSSASRFIQARTTAEIGSERSIGRCMAGLRIASLLEGSDLEDRQALAAAGRAKPTCQL